ncbi:hypothetical protein BsWGS_18446 [Bradybaena similaris]
MFLPPVISACRGNYYGSLCYSKCSEYCVNGTCDYHNGTCPACISGYVGPKCISASPNNETLQNVLIPLSIVTVLVLLCATLLLRKRKPSLDNEFGVEETEQTSDEGS